jgi:nucleotide-binding universal stress UspA family protein
VSSDLAAQGIRVQTHTVVSARRPHTILELAERENVDLIVACAHGATGEASERYGSTAAHLIQWSNRPIVVLQDLAPAVREWTRAEEASQSHPGH